MNWYFFTNNIKTKMNKILAITFASLAICFYLSYIIINTINQGIMFLGKPTNVINFMFLLGTFSVLLIGNIQNSRLAYQGFLMFVFMEVLSLILVVFVQGLQTFVSIFQGFSVIGLLMWLYFLFGCFQIGSGITSYVLSRRYLSNRYYKWNHLRNWTLAFVLSFLVTCSIQIYMVVGIGAPNTLTFSLLFPILSDAMGALACLFTMFRLKGY